MVEANPVSEEQSQQLAVAEESKGGEVAEGEDAAGNRRVKFDEEEIAAYDLTRGQCMPINDPKTPFHEENSDEEMTNEAQEAEVE